ncbi:tubulin-like doman-containing protein [Halorubrum rubrum]|uniref:Tubulin-like doman-containing protein n=1 Tax=Halorubrum rubrum TaxID=1126240 RepID=A0ABD5R0D3_9EURY|nr:tubulin-like doman-containing protein [Halorubrum rubrum]
MNWPNHVFGLGGSGKELVFELLATEWVRESMLDPASDPSGVTVTIIDTAESEREEDMKRIRRIRSAIEETEDRIADDGSVPDGIRIESRTLTDMTRFEDPIDIAGTIARRRIASKHGMDPDDWWIDADQISPNPDVDYGLSGKRSLAKALYYKASAEDENDTLATVIAPTADAEVAVLCGLGGATSGILFDLARELTRSEPTASITLFAVLPNRESSRREQANAHAALSELEYLALCRKQLFEDRILLPTDAVVRDAKRPENRFLGDALDEAFTYLFVSYYSRWRRTGTEHAGSRPSRGLFPDTPSYAPFVVGVPQILRYAVEETRDGREPAVPEETESVPPKEDPSPYATLIRPGSPSHPAEPRHPEESRRFDATDEDERLRERLDALADRACDATYSGLRDRRLTTAMSRDERPVVGTLVSPVADRITERIDFDDVIAGISGSAPVGPDDPSAFAVESGTDRETGFVAFVGGVLLDDLRLSNEYLESYERSALAEGTDASLRHALGLEEGYYVRRRRVGCLGNRDDRSFLDDPDDRIRERVLTDRVETVELGRGGRSGSE